MIFGFALHCDIGTLCGRTTQVVCSRMLKAIPRVAPRESILVELGIMKPVLSVAIPAHNEEKHIARCIESIVVAARYASQPVEVVVALNRCTDKTREISESLGARCVIEDKKCIAAVRNAAVRADRKRVV